MTTKTQTTQSTQAPGSISAAQRAAEVFFNATAEQIQNQHDHLLVESHENRVIEHETLAQSIGVYKDTVRNWIKNGVPSKRLGEQVKLHGSKLNGKYYTSDYAFEIFLRDCSSAVLGSNVFCISFKDGLQRPADIVEKTGFSKATVSDWMNPSNITQDTIIYPHAKIGQLIFTSQAAHVWYLGMHNQNKTYTNGERIAS